MKRKFGGLHCGTPRSLATALAMAALIGPLLTHPSSANASDFACDTEVRLYSIGDGIFSEYDHSKADAEDGGTLSSFAADHGSGWQKYGHVFGGADGRVYAIEPNGNLWRYRLNGSDWDTPLRQQIDTGWSYYSQAARHNQVTADSAGYFYAVDAAGKLRIYHYDETAKAWTVRGKVIDNGWDSFNLIVAAGNGVLYARTGAGVLQRYIYDINSQRWLERGKQVGTGWQKYSNVFSPGGDVLYAIQMTANGAGDVYWYRFLPDTATWHKNSGKKIADNDSGGTVVPDYPTTADADGCKLSRAAIATPSNPAESYTATNAMQSSAGSLEYAFTDNLGRLIYGRQTDPANFESIQWAPLSGNEAFSGIPALAQNQDGRVQVAAQNTTSNAWLRTQSAAGSSDWKPWDDLAGAMKSHPAVARLTDNSLVMFALDSDGRLWCRPQDGPNGDFMGWRILGGTGMRGPITTTGIANQAVAVTAYDANGAINLATYQNNKVSAWTALGGSGFSGTPSVVLYPGYRLRVFGRDGTGRIVTQIQTDSGAFPGTWDGVGGSGFSAAGSPTAVISPQSGKVTALSRGTDGHIYFSTETAQGSGAFGDWKIAQPDGDAATWATDPTLFTYTDSNGPAWAYVVRNTDNQTSVYTISSTASSALRVNGPAFTRHTLPKPPQG
ncbi:tachylectin-related carbohydrate-binding protein [Actinoallomurus purpureus]|uniref:tachylectin-related carbohydrate-binding protein n=1 Tax=Actinoallomurus purpureus TaxID=478114 RepID=UPI00209299D8|nr:tachylectin-related carbohydrate-binding protein [Actinoallomurus purpureus]MCO6006185.1 tachylectin-related carbohydrate-binding protein [Actinoallomurus purpureus]